MAIYIVKSKTGRSFRRSGTSFLPDRWVAIDSASYTDSAAAILAESNLESYLITDDADTDLTVARPVLNAGLIPAAV